MLLEAMSVHFRAISVVETSRMFLNSRRALACYRGRSHKCAYRLILEAVRVLVEAMRVIKGLVEAARVIIKTMRVM